VTRYLESHPRVADVLGVLMFAAVILAPVIVRGPGT